MTSDRPYRKALPLETVRRGAPQVLGHASSTRPASTRCLRLLEREGEAFIQKDQKFDIYAFLEV